MHTAAVKSGNSFFCKDMKQKETARIKLGAHYFDITPMVSFR